MALIDGKLNVSQAAKYVGCSTAFIRRTAQDGKIRHWKLGTRYYFDKKDLERLVTPHYDAKPDIR